MGTRALPNASASMSVSKLDTSLKMISRPEIGGKHTVPSHQSFNWSEMINIRNESFWSGVAAQKRQLEAMSPPWQVPSEDLDEVKRISLKEQAARGGKAAKADLLTRAIRQIVTEDPTISEAGLRRRLATTAGITFLDRNDMETDRLRSAKGIRYLNSGGREKEVSVSVLKDRLSRAKNWSRKAASARTST